VNRFWDPRAGLVMQRPMQVAPTGPQTPTHGYRVNFARTPSGTLVAQDWQTLLRVSDRNVPTWQVTLSPVFRQQVGPVPSGMPTSAAQTGSPRFRMTFGAGGVTFRHEGPYPLTGATFTVAANDIAVEVMANDAVAVFTADTVPAVLGWVTPNAAPQAVAPLFVGYGNAALVGPFTASPWTRALHVFHDTAGSTVTLSLTGPLGTQTIVVPSGTRVPLAGNALRYSATSGAGNVSVTEEISFA